MIDLQWQIWLLKQVGKIELLDQVDEKTIEYLKEHGKKEWKVYEADEDAEYDEVYEIDLSSLRPTVSFPHLPDNTRTIDEVGDVEIDQAVIGSCTEFQT